MWQKLTDFQTFSDYFHGFFSRVEHSQQFKKQLHKNKIFQKNYNSYFSNTL
jgi:hypothetical protein